jgi:hypothetical protein
MPTDKSLDSGDFEQWLAARHTNLRVVKTTTTPRGQILDWIPIESQTPNGVIATPPALEPPVHLDGHRAAQFEYTDPRFEPGPARTVPIVRPTASARAKRKHGSLLLARRHYARLHPEAREPADPNPFGYFHASQGEETAAYGCDGFISVWDPKINQPAGPSDNDHSLMQLWLLDQPHGQSVEFGWTVDEGLNRDTSPHIFSFYTTNNWGQPGDNVGGYNTTYKGWVQTSATIYPGALLTNVSALGGTQVEIAFRVWLDQNNWCISVEGETMGYYPASLFGGSGMSQTAASILFGGEVFSGLANPTLTNNQMGSGRQPSAGANQSAYMRNLRVQTDTAGTMGDSNGQPEQDSGNNGPIVYGLDMHMTSGSTWGSYMYLGGQAP